MRISKMILIAMSLATSVAFAKESPFKSIEECEIGETGYTLLIGREGTQKRQGFFYQKVFTGTVNLKLNGKIIGTFAGAGSEIYSGKRYGYVFSGNDGLGRLFKLESPYDYGELPFKLETEVNGGVHLEFEQSQFSCAPAES